MVQHFRDTTLRVLASDMTAVRGLCALASLFCVLVLLYPDDTMARRGATLLHKVFRTDLVLAAFFALDCLGLLWRIYDRINRCAWDLAVNIFGFLLIFTLVSSVVNGFGFYTLQSGIVTAILCARLWLIVRSGNGPSEVGW